MMFEELYKKENIIILIVLFVIIFYIYTKKNASESFCANNIGDCGVIDQDYISCGTDGAVCDYDGAHDIYYGKVGTNFAKITPSQMPLLPNKKFTCLPAGFSGVDGNPVLPVSDPAPGHEKQCYVKPKSKILESSNSKLLPFYNECAKDFGECNFNGLYDVYYGVPDKNLIKIDKRHITSGKFSCLPIGHKNERGLPVLPVIDPLPGIQKSCYIR